MKTSCRYLRSIPTDVAKQVRCGARSHFTSNNPAIWHYQQHTRHRASFVFASSYSYISHTKKYKNLIDDHFETIKIIIVHPSNHININIIIVDDGLSLVISYWLTSQTIQTWQWIGIFELLHYFAYQIVCSNNVYWYSMLTLYRRSTLIQRMKRMQRQNGLTSLATYILRLILPNRLPTSWNIVATLSMHRSIIVRFVFDWTCPISRWHSFWNENYVKCTVHLPKTWWPTVIYQHN